MRPRTLLLIGALAAAAISPSLNAQAPDLGDPPAPPVLAPDIVSVDDAELQALEDAYANDLSAARLDLGEQYLLALKRLQDNLTSRNQIEQALLVKLERERVAELLEATPEIELPTAGARPLTSVVLDIARARCEGGPVYEAKYRRIRNWTSAGALAQWELDAEMPSGRYEVIIEYAAGNDAGGDFEIAAGTAEPVRKSVDTNADSSWKSVAKMFAGTVPIDADTRVLSLTCVSLRQPYLWTVHSVTLAPPGTWEQIERERIAAALEGAPGNPKVARKLGELETLKGVRLDPAQAATRADRFTIIHEDESLPVRLYGVTAPPTNPADRDAFIPFRKILPRTGEDQTEALVEVGREALDHLRRRLAGTMFNVYTYREPDPSMRGRVFAFVVADGTTLGQSLVERGLAVSERRSAPLPDGTEGSIYIERLRTAEESARVNRLALWDLQPADPKG